MFPNLTNKLKIFATCCLSANPLFEVQIVIHLICWPFAWNSSKCVHCNLSKKKSPQKHTTYFVYTPLLALIGNGAYGANLAKLMWTHVHICFWMAKYRKPKSFKQPFFDWIKITDFFIAKLTVFWSHFSLPKNDQFCY